MTCVFYFQEIFVSGILCMSRVGLVQNLKKNKGMSGGELFSVMQGSCKVFVWTSDSEAIKNDINW